jgi:AcrR family transcriptional regulator
VGVAERREREREHLRGQIMDAARDLLLEQGLAGLSMRAIAERIEYSPATIYIYFRDKDELIRAVVQTGFERLGVVIAAELRAVGETADASAQYSALGRAYARFALENPSYFRVMFELPSTAELTCAQPAEPGQMDGRAFDAAVALVARAVEEGSFDIVDPRRTTIIGWGVMHGLTSLYLAGHLREDAPTPDAFLELIQHAMQSLYDGWGPKCTGGEDV